MTIKFKSTNIIQSFNSLKGNERASVIFSDSPTYGINHK